MKPRSVACAAMVLSVVAERADACPCQGSSGPGGSVTTEADRFGMSLTETARTVQGAFRPHGDYASLAAGDRQASLDVTALAGYRVVPDVEVSAEAAFGHETDSSPYLSSARTGFGDLTLRIRWDAVDEPMPFTPAKPPWPAFSIVAGVRAPTAARGATSSRFSGTTGSVGASASSEGLGAWEGSLAAVLSKTLGTDWQVVAVLEGAYRLPDTWTGIPRHLAPRLFGQAGVRYSPSDDVSVGMLTDLGYEGDVVYDDVPVPDSSQRLWTVSGYFVIKPSGTRFRWGLLTRSAPHVEGIGKNAVAATSVAVSIGYAAP